MHIVASVASPVLHAVCPVTLQANATIDKSLNVHTDSTD